LSTVAHAASGQIMPLHVLRIAKHEFLLKLLAYQNQLLIFLEVSDINRLTRSTVNWEITRVNNFLLFYHFRVVYIKLIIIKIKILYLSLFFPVFTFGPFSFRLAALHAISLGGDPLELTIGRPLLVGLHSVSDQHQTLSEVILSLNVE
jgi:hypothetical protein